MSEVRTLGVTGGIGSGKSTVCAYLKDLGAIIFEADRRARDLMETDPRIKHEVISAFGAISYHPNGSLNRSWLASQVFDNDSKLFQLNSIIHPRVMKDFTDLKAHLPSGLLVHESALIYETKLHHDFDAICVIIAPDVQRIQRVMIRDQITEDSVRARMNHQLPQHEIQDRADVVLLNGHDKKDLLKKTRSLYHLAVSTVKLGPETFRSHRQL